MGAGRETGDSCSMHAVSDPHEPSGPPPDSSLPHAAQREVAALAGRALAGFFACLPATVWMTDRRLALTMIQGPMLSRINVDPERILGRTLPDLLLDGREDHPLIQGHLTALAGHETSVRIEWGGNIYSARIAPLRDAVGAIIGCVGAHQQIGWLPDDEETVRESDARLQRIIDSNMIGIVFGNDEGEITDANDAFLHLAGYTREELTTDGISWPALTPVESHVRQFEAFEEVRRTGRCKPFELDLIRKDGSRVAVLVGGARLSARRRDGVAFVLDISERRQFRRRLAAELGVADTLLDAPTPEAGIAPALAAMCRELEWAGAQYWYADGTCAGATGSLSADEALSPLVRHALSACDEAPQRDRRRIALAIRLDDRSCGAIVLDAGIGPADDESFEAVRSIGARIAKRLAR